MYFYPENSQLTYVRSPNCTWNTLYLGSGAILASILGVMDAYLPSPLDIHRPLFWHRFIEACKFGYAGRTEMGDWHSPEIREMMKEMIQNLTSQEWTEHIRSQIDDTR